MTADEFRALLDRRSELEREHDTACAILAEEGPDPGGVHYDRCARLHAEMTECEEQIEAALDEERRSEAASEEPPAA